MTEEEKDDLEVKFNAFLEYEDECEDITDWEKAFIHDQIKRLEQYGERSRFSDKQMAIIDRVYGKLPV